MCGHDWCSVRISKEIAEFDSGKVGEFQRERVLKSPALNDEQRAVLERRGVLAPEEIHRLASKTRKAVLAEPGKKAVCHSDRSSSSTARDVQNDLVAQENLIQIRRPPAAE
jgi:phosphomethylpyrimidine synthase